MKCVQKCSVNKRRLQKDTLGTRTGEKIGVSWYTSHMSRDRLPINPLCLWHTMCSYRSKPFNVTQTKDTPLSFPSVFVSWHSSLLRLLPQKKGKMHYQIAVIINFLGHCISMVALLVAFFLFLCLRWVCFFVFFVAAAAPTHNPADILDMTGNVSALNIPHSGAPLVLIGKNHLVMGWSIPYLNPADVKGGQAGVRRPQSEIKRILKKRKKKLGHPPPNSSFTDAGIINRCERGEETKAGFQAGPAGTAAGGEMGLSGKEKRERERERGVLTPSTIDPRDAPIPTPSGGVGGGGKSVKGHRRANKRTSNSWAFMHKPCSRASAGTANRDAAGTGGFLSSPFCLPASPICDKTGKCLTKHSRGERDGEDRRPTLRLAVNWKLKKNVISSRNGRLYWVKLIDLLYCQHRGARV